MRQPVPAVPSSVPAAAMAVLLDTLEEIGGDVPGALRRSGLTLIEAALREGRARLVSRAAIARLAGECILAFHYESCRKNGMKPFPVRNHRILLLAMLGCPTLREAIGVMTDFYAMLGDRVAEWTVSEAGNVVRFTIDRRTREKSVPELLISIFSLASYHRILGWLISAEVPLIDVTVAYPASLRHAALPELFSISPRFGQAGDSFAFASHFLDRPIARKPSELDALFALFPFDLLPPDYGDESLSSQVIAAIRAALSLDGQTPGIDTLARMFGMTSATFRRRLKREGSSLVQLRMQCRRDLAFELLRGTTLSVREISARLQYVDVATFRRAFTAWTNMPPAAWRLAASSPTAV
ncbi:hypothetical protein ACFB49_06560 [Sphingomonas sp. DBB INV C78]|uniref:helix-turn-helix domain-containing protein n=1 Tax=Sphingomonas sp. DBB INV C78 TaxID=3349434 RepID=UPI0036D2EB7E